MWRRLFAYALASIVFLILVVLAFWPWLDDAGRRGLVAAAAVAWPIQIVAFGILMANRFELKRFLIAWVAGTLVRMALIGIAAVALTRWTTVAMVPTLLGLAGFFFGLLLLEPVFFRY